MQTVSEYSPTQFDCAIGAFSELADKGQVVRYHGGAKLPDPSEDSPSYENRNSTNSDAKAAASELLLNLIPNGATLFLAGGSTLAIAARVLARRENLTIITNNIHAAVTLYDRAGINVFVSDQVKSAFWPAIPS